MNLGHLHEGQRPSGTYLAERWAQLTEIAGRARIPNWLTEKFNRPAVVGMLVS